jgi:hypothetical protein
MELQLTARGAGSDSGAPDREFGSAIRELLHFLKVRVIAVHRLRIYVAIE